MENEIISIINPKGGTAKSTISWNLAFSKTIQKRFKSIGLIDMDAQGTLHGWWEMRRENKLETESIDFSYLPESDEEMLATSIGNLLGNNEILFIDCPGESIGFSRTKIAAYLASLVIVPMRTSTSDENAFERNLLPIIESIKEEKSDAIFYIIPTFVHPNTKTEKIVQYVQDVTPDCVLCLNSVLFHRVVFENFNREGMNLYEYAETVRTNRQMYAQAQKAIQDIEGIANQLVL
jgi:cellulose biosynthesis protein BcsQ